MVSKKLSKTVPVTIGYALYFVVALLGIAISTWMEADSGVIWSSVRWAVRIAVIAGAVWALYSYRRDPRPLWVYSLLGFALYECVSVLLMLAVWGMDNISYTLPSMELLVPLLFALAFVPEAGVALWVSFRSTRLAAYTVFSHAAITLPLFALSGILPVATNMDGLLIASLLPIALAGAAASAYSLIPQQVRWYYLYGSVAVCQTVFAIGLSIAESIPIFAAPFLIGLGLFVLTIPVILFALYRALLGFADRLGWADQIPSAFLPKNQSDYQSVNHVDNRSLSSASSHGGNNMSDQSMNDQNAIESTEQPVVQTDQPSQKTAPPAKSGPGKLDRLYKGAVVVLTVIIVLAVGLVVARATVYKVHEYERGLHLRGGRFMGVQQPGWHMQIPMVDTVIIVKTNERLGYIEQIPAMTSDNVTMDVSLQYTYKVDNPEQYALQVDDPERIVFEFVQGKLRDVVNTKEMSDIMERRAVMNQEVMDALKEREEQYGVEFVTVQMQSASPPEEVLTAIKDRMVALQRQEQAQAEAAQRQTQADAELYAAEKQADAEAYQITTTALADAERIRLTTAAEKEAVRALIAELEDKGELGEAFIEYLIAQELKENSKWVIGGGGTPIIDLR